MSIFRLLLITPLVLFSNQIDFAPYLESSFEQSIKQVGAHPVWLDMSEKEWDATFAAFVPPDQLCEMAEILATHFPHYIAQEKGVWKDSGYKFGIFGKELATHKKKRLIQGTNCKMTREYIDWLREMRPEAMTPALERLFSKLDRIDAISQKVFGDLVSDYGDLSYTYRGQKRLPVSIRLIRFERSPENALPLHQDISVLSLIFPSNDAPDNEHLVVAPADGRPFKVLDLRRVVRPRNPARCCGLVITGAQIDAIAPHLHASPHGVLPHGRGARCVIVTCLHVPKCDTSNKSTLLPKLNKVPDHLLDPMREIDAAGPGTLVVLDIGNTLLYEKDGLWQMTDARWPKVISRCERAIALTRTPPADAIRQARAKTMREEGLACEIVESDARLKGQRLKEWIESCADKPTRVIVVDDQVEQLESISQACEELSIPCTTIHYLKHTSLDHGKSA